MAVERSEDRAAVDTSVEGVAGEPRRLGHPGHTIIVSRRDLLRAGAFGGTAVALGGLGIPMRELVGPGSITGQPGPDADPALAAATPTLTASVLRREDMLALRLDFYNLVRSGMSLVRQSAANPALIVATLGYGADHAPQNVAEEAFPESGTPAAPGDVQAALAGATRLAFLVPASLTSIPYSLSTILGLFPGLGLNVAPAALPAGATPATAPVLADPDALQTRIEAPWNLVLSPHAGASWSHASAPVTRNGRTELWHTRLSEADPTGRTLRAVWTDGYDPSTDPGASDPGPFLTSLTPNERSQIVRLTSQFGIPGWTPVPVQADRLMLSALGAWLDSDGAWPDAAPGDLLAWRHLATMGRDQFVKTVHAGFLFPFGHSAALVKITERKVGPVPSGPLAGAPAAYLRQRQFIVVRQPVVEYPEGDDNEPFEGRQRPFRRVELRTLVTPDLDPVAGRPIEDGFFPQAGGGAEVRFTIVATDREGRSSEFTMPLVYVPEGIAETPSAVEAIVGEYNLLPDDGLALRRGELAGAKVGFAPSEKPGDAASEVKTLTFGAGAPAGSYDIHQGDLPFYPSWTSAAVRLDAVEQIRGRGVGGDVVIEPHQGYLDDGFDAPNPAEVFAKIKEPFWLRFSDGGGDRSGGVITPDMYLVNLSRKLGPQSGDPLAADPNELPLDFDPERLLPEVKILGAIDLFDVVRKVAGFGDRSKLPEMKTRTIHEADDPSRPVIATETRFTYRPELKEDPKGIFNPGQDGSLTLDVTYRTPLVPPGEPTYEIVGDLRRFQVLMLAKDPESVRFVRLTFARLTFTSRSGAKPDIHPEISKVEFDGPLKFVDSIKDYLKTPGTGPFIDVAPDSVSAGFNLQIPNIAAGAMTLMNIVFSAALRIPFNGSPARARFALSSREHPFLCTWIGLGGGGFFALELGLDGIELFEMDTVGGASAALDCVLVTVEVHAYFGVHLGFGKDLNGNEVIDQVSYIRYGGHCNVWGFWGFTIELYLGLEYDGVRNELWGQATLTVELTYMWLTKDVELSVERRIAGPSNSGEIAAGAGGGLGATALFRPGESSGGVVLASATQEPATTTAAAADAPPLGYATLVSQNEWNTYAAAFAADA